MRSLLVRPLLATTAALALLASAANAQDLGLPLGAHAPAAALQTLDGKAVNLSDYIGKGPVLLEFWATWCENCHEMEPSLKAAVTQYGDRVKFIGVAVSVNQSPERVKRYAAAHGLTHQLLFDNSGAATDAYRVPATSYVVMLDKTGKVVYTGLGGDQKVGEAVAKGLGGSGG